MDHDFTLDSDERLVGYFADWDGSSRWNHAVEVELQRRGFVTRHSAEDGGGRCLPTRNVPDTNASVRFAIDDGAWSTTEINGRDYVLFACPFQA